MSDCTAEGLKAMMKLQEKCQLKQRVSPERFYRGIDLVILLFFLYNINTLFSFFFVLFLFFLRSNAMQHLLQVLNASFNLLETGQGIF